MNQLFNEKANALNKYMYELLSQKAGELEELSAEYEP